MSDAAEREYFLSYSRTDEAVALRFASDLIAGGVSLWVDQYDIRASQHWDSAIEEAVRRCCGLLVILSPRSARSPNVADEVAVAIETGKRVIPILIEKCTVPLRMTRLQLIDATVDYDRALQKCLEEIGKSIVPARPAIENASTATGPDAARGRPSAASGPGGVPPEAVRRAAQELTQFLGPIATHLANREAASASSGEQLCQRLSLRIPSEKERAAFLEATKAAQRADRTET